eukprot:TRINITY_DN4554_c0_g2_i1.p1 TRINITY_DN4554_c0_g2~~TRINITY_DN4554_c0_g2_i1.p1  ORF type:complete len:558 (+),score=68.88 TRINITY_DN4554_c0_g2_i1:27-1676(+)
MDYHSSFTAPAISLLVPDLDSERIDSPQTEVRKRLTNHSIQRELNKSSQDKPGITVFFKAGDATKKCKFSGETMEDLKDDFFSKFEDMAAKYTEKRAVQFMLSHKDTKIVRELDDIKNVYPNCVLEVHVPQLEKYSKKDVGFGYYAFQRQKLVFAMVGLPARGKSYVARKMARYLQWVGVPTRVFNVASYRRERLGAAKTAEFFDPLNEAGSKQRLHMAIAALDDMLNFLNSGGKVAIYDATSTTKERRSMILKRCAQESVQVVFIESICNDPNIIDNNIRDITPDYSGQDMDQAIADFKKRIALYEQTYEPLDGDDGDTSYVKIIDRGRQYIVNKINSYLLSRVIYFLMNLHVTPRPIWLSRHGESEWNSEERVGGDPPLSEKGDNYAHVLADWVESRYGRESERLSVWTSTLKRSIATAQYINFPKINLRALDEIDAGICDGMTYEEIAERMPEEFAARAANKLGYRYPHGESYIDVIQRLEPVLFEIERLKTPVLIVGHQAVLRCLYSYFLGIDAEEIPYVPIQTHAVYELTPRAYSCDVKIHKLM